MTKKYDKKKIVLTSGVIALFIFMAVILFYQLNRITMIDRDSDIVQIAFTGEMNEESAGNEIWIKNYSVEGVTLTDYRLKSGTWLENNSLLGWRAYETGINLTPMIELKMPIGKNRYINFEKNKWRGIVIINYDGDTQIIDCYDNTESPNSIISVKVPESPNNLLIKINIRNFILIGILALIFVFFFLHFSYNRDTKKITYEQIVFVHKTEMLLFIISYIFLLFMIQYSNYKSLWADDMAQISFTFKNLSITEMFHRLLIYDVQPPVFAIITAIWLRIAPYGTAWLKLISEVAVVIGIYYCGKAGNLLGGKKAAVLCSLLAGTSSSMILECSYTFRPYGYYFLFASIVFYMYIGKEKESKYLKKDLLKFALGMAALVYTHYFGLIICFSLFCSDIIIYIKQRKDKIFIIPYFIVGIAYLPWIFAVMTKSLKTFSTFWPQVPNLQSIMYAFYYLVSMNKMILGLLMLFIVYYIVTIFAKNFKVVFEEKICLTLVWSILCMIGITFMYSAIINPSRSVFVTRYFTGLFPAIFILIGFSLFYLLNEILHIKNNEIKLTILILIISLTGFINLNGVISTVNQKYQTYEETAEWLRNQNDIYNDNILVVLSSGWSDGWDYYLTHDWKEPVINRVEANNLTNEMLNGIDKLYVFQVHMDMSSAANEMIQNQFNQTSENQELSLKVYEKK